MTWIDDQAPHDLAADGIVQLTYLGPAPTGRYDAPAHGTPAPQAFKVANGPEKSPLRTHFHTVDQFQYIASGNGKLGAHRVRRGLVHYADRFTPYGPLAPGDEGLDYVTMRPTTDMGISFMPESRDELRDALAEAGQVAGERRSVTLDLADPAAGTPGADGWTDVLHDDDQLRVATATAGPGEAVDTPATEGDGAYLVVVDGSLDDDGTTRPAGSLHWCAPGARVRVVAGPDGVRLAHLQFPHRAHAAATTP